ncbi:MAG TPA: DUF1592 domain-containing protein [Lacunisphaera sp.]|jgi:hypothetical protein
MILRRRFSLTHFINRKGRGACFLVCAALFPTIVAVAADSDLQVFQRDIQPILEDYCYDCHGDGSKKGGVQLDGFETETQLHDNKLWMRALRNVRSGIMPPADEPRLPADLAAKVSEWIKRGPFGLDPHHPDPGRVTVRRLNRVDYRNTIRDLMGVDYDTQKEFPADDTGHGFDNIGDVLTISPMLLEKYLDAAQTVVATVVPTKALAVAENVIDGRAFVLENGPVTMVAADLEKPSIETGGTSTSPAPAIAAPAFEIKRPAPTIMGHALDLSYYTPAKVIGKVSATHAGKYKVTIDLKAVEKYVDDQFDYNRCRLLFKIDGQPMLDREFVRQGEAMPLAYTYEQEWAPGDHDLTFEVQPIAPDREQKRLLRIRVNSVRVEGPAATEYWVKPKGYDRFFPKPVPVSAEARRTYAEELLRKFADRAFRRPVDEATLNRLVAVAEGVYSQPNSTFEAGIAQAMVAVLASPRFIFREEGMEPMQPGQLYAQVDEYALASRLSYFFWSSMPDDELFQLAAAGQLRANLDAQIDRMLKSPRSEQFVRNFTGQWLEARDISSVQINAFAIYLREHPDPALEKAQATFRHINLIPEEKRTPEEVAEFARARKEFFASFRAPKPQLTGDLRDAMEKETEMDFAYLLKEDRSLLEMIECDYTFLNEELAKHYGISGVTGSQMRKVQLPPGSPRGGVLTQGTTLAVTSNPTRTSPVKRGVFILAAILGTPPAPPPPNIPPLEEAAGSDKSKPLSLRETLAIHRSNKLCSSCHGRMDPLGLALENFNAMGAWRDRELNQPVEPAGQLITGEKFADIRELKHILATKHRRDYYYCIAEKMLTYALGRGVEYYDTDTLDQLVAALEASGGRPSALFKGIVESAPFQQSRPRELTRTAEQTPAPSPIPQG